MKIGMLNDDGFIKFILKQNRKNLSTIDAQNVHMVEYSRKNAPGLITFKVTVRKGNKRTLQLWQFADDECMFKTKLYAELISRDWKKFYEQELLNQLSQE